MRIFIEPLDVLLFRDGRPFSAGEDHLARAIFPPSPRTFQGALRSYILATKFSFDTESAKSVIGDSDHDYGQLKQMKGPFLARRENGQVAEYFPAPLDLACPTGKSNTSSKDEKTKVARLLQPRPPFWESDLPGLSRALWSRQKDRVETARGFISAAEMQRYLMSTANANISIVKPGAFYEWEPRVAIKKSAESHTVEEGLLYSVQFLRMKNNTGFVVELEGLNEWLPAAGVLTLGGENRPASFQQLTTLEQRPWDYSPIIQKIERTGRFKLYLATPAILNGWLPSGISPDKYEGTLKGIPVKLVAAAVGRPIALGGWDLQARKPRPIRMAVPAGSVYYFELERSEDAPELFSKLWRQSVQEDDSKIAGFEGQIGFGITFIGGWNNA